MPASIAPIGTYTVFGTVTDVRIENTSAVAQANLPVTFGQVFGEGHLMPADTLVGGFEDGTSIPLQIDVKATHPDGSVRHAVVSGIVPSLAAGQGRAMSLMRTNAPQDAGLGPQTLLANGFSSSVHATIGGVRYYASADDLIKTGAPVQTWLSGSVANEWHVSTPLMTADGVVHPHLSARFAIRWYDAIKKARVDVTIENAWAYEPNPQNITYDAEVMVRGAVVYSKPAMTHYHHARWRKTFWWGGDAGQAYVKHNTAYLIASRAVPNYDQSFKIAETELAALKTKFSGTVTEPMNVGLAVKAMATTGGRDDIGLLPSWATSYLLSMDKRAKDATLGTADLAGSWSMHFRDKNTGKPITLMDYPYMTILGNIGDTKNPATGKYEAFPTCPKTVCTTPYSHDSSHQANFAYLPYLVTGDHYYLEELQFWSMWNVFSSNPGYRSNIKGLLHRNQVRGQAWSLRSVAEAAYITPDSDRLKGHFNQILTNNLDYYTSHFTNGGAGANALGVITTGSAIVYSSELGVAPWQDDFFTSALGHTAELGFTKALPLLQWKATFPIERMIGDGTCWVGSAMYKMNVRPTSTSPLYTTIAEAFKASSPDYVTLACGSAEMAASLDIKIGEMSGYATSVMGYPANMQPALAYAATFAGARGAAAWAKFEARPVKPDYSKGAQFAIRPR
ncbi:RIFT barrel domain-containing protein [Massilia sp. SYSU DXS3249]